MTSNSESINCSLSGIYKSWYAFRAQKQASRSIITFEYNLENNLDQLANDLQSKHYRHGGYAYRVVSDSKTRHIAIADVRDRVVHRLLYDYFVPLMDHRFDYDVWSCREGKGLEAAIKRSRTLLNRYSDAWVWRGDVSKFFDSVSHEKLMQIMSRYVKDANSIAILQEVINSYKTSPSTGIAIGNLTSQILSNVYLNEFDRFARHRIKPLGYLRYGDDFILLLPTQMLAFQAQAVSIDFLDTELSLNIHARNNIVIPARSGLHFLGINLFTAGTSIQARTWRRMERRLDITNQASYQGLVNKVGSVKQKREFPWIRLS